MNIIGGGVEGTAQVRGRGHNPARYGQNMAGVVPTQTAHAAQRGRATTDEQLAEASSFLRGFFSGTANQRARYLPKAPLRAMQTAALHDPDPFARRTCLFFLDHYANDESTAVFREALHDPVAFVRTMALHSLPVSRARWVGSTPTRWCRDAHEGGPAPLAAVRRRCTCP